MIYFAYGSNLNPAQMYERCPLHRTIGVAHLRNHRLVFPRFSPVRRCATAGLVETAGDNVWGVLYQLADEDIPVLHFHEGYDPDVPVQKNRYALRQFNVMLIGSPRPEAAMSYVALPDGTDELPSRAYLDTILDGARYHGLPKAWLVYLESVAVAA
jgi:hypothetical protein